jgi:fumarylacetoacetase
MSGYKPTIDATHASDLRSCVESANGHEEFPIQNLPIGVFAPDGQRPRGGIAIGDMILDLGATADAGLLTDAAALAARTAGTGALNAYLSLGSAQRAALRQQLSQLLRHDSAHRTDLADAARPLLYPAAACEMHLPAQVGNFTDCMSSYHHMSRVGRQMQSGSPVYPNFHYVPIAYHSRASSVRVSGTELIRPCGQFLRPGATEPAFGPSEQLDYEVEIALWIAGENPLGQPVPIAQAAQRIAGISLLNDWSARDIQRWETLPLGPFLGKNFLTSVSPWIVSAEALAPFRTSLHPRPQGNPAPLPYLYDADDQQCGALQLSLETLLLTARMAADGLAPQRLALASLRDLYWTPAQLITHHTSNGCNLRAGDLIGTGTVSGPEEADAGCLLELTRRGRQPLQLANGEQRPWLYDGDEVILRAHCRREGFATIGLGECRGRVAAAAA